MTDSEKQVNYQNYVDAEIEMDRTPMPYDEFIESLIAEVGE